jgi:4-hydroxy-tetrahydrodipicolinate synthase
MTDLNLRGIFPALATPYHEDESLDEEGLRAFVRRLAPDVDGFVVNGTTGDFPLLTPEERRRAVEVVAEEMGGERLIIAGTGAVATRDAIDLTRAALGAGADAALIVAPYYLRPSPAGLRAHYAAVAESVPELPILLYNFPQLVGQPIPVEVVRDLALEHENVMGMKDTSGDLAYLLAVLESVPPSFRVLAGQGLVALPALASGAVGAILADANLIPARWQAVLAAVEGGDLEAARRGQLDAQVVSRVIAKGGSLAVRAGLEMLGHPIGPPRRPLTGEEVLNPEDLATLRRALLG